MSKRPNFSITSQVNKKPKSTSSSQSTAHHNANRNNPANKYLSRPVPSPEESLKTFLLQARTSARANVPKETPFPITKPFAEIEARLGIVKISSMRGDQRVLSSGPKQIRNSKTGRFATIHAFDCTPIPNSNGLPPCKFEGGITRSHFTHWTVAGLSEVSPLSSAFGVNPKTDSSELKRTLQEVELVETVYGGYPNHDRIVFPGDHSINGTGQKPGVMEHKTKLATMDLALPSSPYDMRITLNTERKLAEDVRAPTNGWRNRRLKRRRSYRRRDRNCQWQVDVTEITNSVNESVGNGGGGDNDEKAETLFEIEVELDQTATLALINETDQTKIMQQCTSLSRQLWWILKTINPQSDVGDVEDLLREHPNNAAVKLAQAQCGALRRFMEAKKRSPSTPVDANYIRQNWSTAISPDGKNQTPSVALCNDKFPGCMPVNFSRENIESVQRSSAYHLSEKTDGVRYFLVFTGDTAVLIDRRMKGKQPIPRGDDQGDPMAGYCKHIRPGTVLDGEVVMNRKFQRPIFIVFDVMCTSAISPVLHLPFGERLSLLEKESFRKEGSPRLFSSNSNPAAVEDKKVALPLVKKNFVKRTELDTLLSHVVEEKGMRTYRNGVVHDHLTDGIIFQPNSPYVCSTDHDLLKWKYLDTVTIDVKIMAQDPSNFHYNPNQNDDDEDVLNVFVTGEEGSYVNMTRFIHLPPSERRRLEADRAETDADVAEVGFDPTTGEWYYLTMRPDKEIPNHISTVLGTLLELAESLNTEELRYRMSVPVGMRDTYRKSMRQMQRQLLDCQRKDIRKMKEHRERRR